MDKSIKGNEKLINERIMFLLKYKFLELGLDKSLTITNKGIETIKYYIQPETVVQWGGVIAETIETIKLDPTKFNLEKFMIDCMNVHEFINNVSVLDKDIDIIGLYLSCKPFHYDDYRPIKSFMFTFPQYAKEILYKIHPQKDVIDKKFVVPKEENESMTRHFSRLINAMDEIFGNTSIGDKISVCKNMITERMFNADFANLMQLKGIGPIFAKRLFECGIKDKTGLKELYKSDSRKLMTTLMVSNMKLRKMMDEI